ncbi:MAG: hypothetical protein CSA81_05535 [Acidobacteria bacterium]|nr:MAG: hypothetical protein CSA81_05535 [Acidobacteriota bacterium]PIE90949.1 MAG: hypothetical protein CR997_03575 [Acidobacteriota bacterium]
MNSHRRFQQMKALFEIETKKILWGKRGIPTLLLALLPVVLFGSFFLISLLFIKTSHPPMGQPSATFAAFFQVFMLRSIVFFSAVWIFMNLFRADFLDNSLHYYLLSPLKREYLVLGKFLAGAVSSTLLMTLSTTLAILLFQMSFGMAELKSFFLQNNGFLLILQYDLIIFLACLGYGSVFLLMGLLFRNAIIPAMLLYLWEWINFLLPSLLKKASVIYYLKALAPIPVSEGPLAMAADPIPAWLAVFGLVAFSLVMILLAALKIRRMELSYGQES